jgi:uncharacterized protein involved in response to NO
MGQHWRAKRSGNIPRGIATDGLPLLSYGFRPFFLAAGLFALIAMSLWLGAVFGGWSVGGSSYGAVLWHAHEMLFGYTTAALAGFLLTTIPNWTGRLPVSGAPLLGLILLWTAGRLVMAAPDLLGGTISAVIDGAFLPVLLFTATREIVVGKRGKNLKVVVALALLTAINIGFHAAVLSGSDTASWVRATIAVYISLVGLVGGRIIPSFTRNWLARIQAERLPAPFGGFDICVMIVLVVALGTWTMAPHWPLTPWFTAIAASAHVARLLRWRGTAARDEPMVVVLHLGYAFIPTGLVALTLAELGLISSVSAVHLLTVGGIAGMTLAVMTRATRGHTGRPIRASKLTLILFAAIFVAAAIRPLAEMLPDLYFVILGTSGTAWMAAFSLFTVEYGAMLVQAKPKQLHSEPHLARNKLAPPPPVGAGTMARNEFASQVAARFML